MKREKTEEPFDLASEGDAEEVAEREQVARGTSSGEPHPGSKANPALDRCRDERDKLAPHETARCAGELLEEEYENEEDGGS